MQNSDGMWYLTPENSPDAYRYSYIFDKEQVLEFKYLESSRAAKA